MSEELERERDMWEVRCGEADRRVEEAQRERDDCREQVPIWERTVAHWKDSCNIYRAERDSLAADLAALRATVEEARVELREFVAEGGYEFEARTAPEAFLQQELKDIIARVRAILTPPEGP